MTLKELFYATMEDPQLKDIRENHPIWFYITFRYFFLEYVVKRAYYRIKTIVLGG